MPPKKADLPKILAKKQVNHIEVKPVHLPTQPIENIKGYEYFPSLLANVFLLAKKKSGKTSAIRSILLKSLNKDSRLIVFSATAGLDPTWLKIKEELEDKDIPVTIHDSIDDEGVDLLASYINVLTKPEEPEVDELEPQFIYNQITGDYDIIIPGEEIKKKESKIKTAKIYLVIDDLSHQTRHPSVQRLLKIHRHLGIFVIISSQYIHDLTPSSIKQLDYCLIWPGLDNEKLELIEESLDLPISLDKFIEIYKDATSEKFNFLWIDVRNGEFRHNFNNQYILE